jgi:hypothetical protein
MSTLIVPPACNGIHTWGSFRSMIVRHPDGTERMDRVCPSCRMTMKQFAEVKTPDRIRPSRS